MSSPAQSKPQQRKKVGDPVGRCTKVAKKKGAILVEVRTYSSLKPERKPVAGVKVEVSEGPTAAGAKRTSGNGRAEFPGLEPGSYKVTIKVEGGMRRYYDLDPEPPPQSKGVVEEKTTPYYFELRSYWIAFFVTYPDGKPALGIEREVRFKKMKGAENVLDADWSVYTEGMTGKVEVLEEYIPKGRYQLRVKIVSDPVWSKTPVVLGEAVDLSATVSGFDDGAAGSFEIFDARNLAKPLHSIPAKVAADAMKVSWTPEKGQLQQLVSGWLVFQAKVSKAQAFSGEAKVVTKTVYDVVDKAGAPVDTPINFYFSGGDTADSTSAGGKAEVLIPWKQSLVRIELPKQTLSRVEVDDGEYPARKFLLPK
jgi:hypothetical protein